MRRIAILVLSLFAADLAVSEARAEPFTFMALGDMPYGDPAEVYPPFEALLAAINAEAPALLIHVGDIKAGGTPCTDALFADQLAYMNTVEAPVLYTPGDNEWTDCHRSAAGGFDPLERLDALRTLFFADPSRTLGARTAAVADQSDAGYPENARMMHEDVMFMTAHVVGSNNNFEVRDEAAVAEYFARDRATLDWLAAGFDAAKAEDAAAVVVVIHANMFTDDFRVGRGWTRHSGFKNFGEALEQHAIAYERPVLLIYGDSHVFEELRPFPVSAPNVHALQVPGAAAMHAVTITVDTAVPGAFTIAHFANPALTD